MPNFLNKGNHSFAVNRSAKIYVDKSLLIKKTNELLGTPDEFMCVTRPRRFGKSMAVSLLNAYYSKGCDSRELFRGLKIYNDPSFEEHLNKHNVIWIDMASIYNDSRSGRAFLNKLARFVRSDLDEAFPGILTSDQKTIMECLSRINNETGERFVFLIDEWDVLFRKEASNKELCDSYMKLLSALFKSSDAQSYLDLVYMTGILPIKRYSSQSDLNNFKEYNMLNPRDIPDSFGFTEGEVKALCEKWNINFDEVKSWYDGYRLKGMEIYNPKSVVEALTDHLCGNYWTSTGNIDPVKEYMNYDGGALKGEIIKMLAGEKVPVNVELFRNDLTNVNSKDAALTVLIHLGYLGYEEESKKCFIPNKEIEGEIVNAIQDIPWPDVYNPMQESKKLLEETLKGNTGYIDEVFDKNHAELSTIYSKNKEDVLSTIAIISYYNASKHYFIFSEPNCPTGRADLLFTPRVPGYIPIIIELKVDHFPEKAIQQIKDRNYVSTLKGYHGKVMLLGIAYDSKSLKHHSKIEYVEL